MSDVIAILGMHRSGTSSLTGLLEQAGVCLGTVATKSTWNAKGNRENRKIMDLHEELLRANGGGWDAPPPTVSWPARARAARDAIIRDYQGVPLWGFKDPRTVLVLEGWLEALPRLRLVGVFRHPLLVAESLQRRDGFSIEKGVRLWHVYNEALLAHHRRRAFPILSFDVDAFTESFKRLTRLLRLPERSEGGWDFFDPGLRHQAPGIEMPLGDDTRRLYAALNELAA